MNDINSIFQKYLDSHIDAADLDFSPLLQQYPQHKESLAKKISAYKRAVALLKDDTKPEVETPHLIGREFGGCKLVRILGQGGMGLVYLGHQEKLNRDVVVKVLRPFAENNCHKEYMKRAANSSSRYLTILSDLYEKSPATRSELENMINALEEIKSGTTDVDPDFYKNMATLYYRNGKCKKTIESIDIAINLDPNNKKYLEFKLRTRATCK